MRLKYKFSCLYTVCPCPLKRKYNYFKGSDFCLSKITTTAHTYSKRERVRMMSSCKKSWNLMIVTLLFYIFCRKWGFFVYHSFSISFFMDTLYDKALLLWTRRHAHANIMIKYFQYVFHNFKTENKRFWRTFQLINLLIQRN